MQEQGVHSANQNTIYLQKKHSHVFLLHTKWKEKQQK